MPLEVIGAGFGRTGTKSMKKALEQLGYDRCHHMDEVIPKPRQMNYWTRASLGETMDWDLNKEAWWSAIKTGEYLTYYEKQYG